MEVTLVVGGLFFVAVGGLAVLNHPVVDRFNRTVKALGTTRRAADVEMSGVSVLVGRVAGALIALWGVGMILGGL